jgi:hypothetical protein
MTWQATGWRNACGGLLLMLVGCTTTRPPPALSSATGDASWREVVPAGTARYQLALGEVSSGDAPFQRVAPVYPPELLVSCPSPQEVPALLIVDEAGKVGEVRVADEARADAGRRAFIAAVRVAARRWQFNSLTINHWAADTDGNSHVVDSRTRPFSQGYVFRFECHAGKATVSAAATKP